MSLAASMLDDDALRADDGGFALDVHLNWYRSLPLSSVQSIELTVDGHAIPRDEITFSVNGRDYALDDLAKRYADMWFVLDPATLRVRRPLVRPGDTAEVRVRLCSRVPYILTGPGRALEHATERSKSLVAR